MPRYTDEQIKEAFENAYSYAGVLRFLGIRLSGGSSSHIKRRIERANIDTTHFLGKAHYKNKILTSKRKKPEEVLILRESGHRAKAHLLRRCMIESGIEYSCTMCGNDGNWMGEKLTLHVDHIDGNWLDDRLENLNFLCPNCHSLKTRKQRKINI